MRYQRYGVRFSSSAGLFTGKSYTANVSQWRFYKRAIPDTELIAVLPKMRSYETWRNSRTV